MEIWNWFLNQAPETRTIITVLGAMFMRESIPALWRFITQQQITTTKALESAQEGDKLSSQLVKLLSENLSTLSKTLKSLERIGSSQHDLLLRVDDTTQSTRKELQSVQLAERLKKLETTQQKQSRLLVQIYKQTGGIIPSFNEVSHE